VFEFGVKKSDFRISFSADTGAVTNDKPASAYFARYFFPDRGRLFQSARREPQVRSARCDSGSEDERRFAFRVFGVSHFGSHSGRVMMARRDRRLPSRAPRVLALALLIAASVAGAAAEATKWTPAEFERSLFATRGSRRKDPDVTPTPHLLKLYAPWCGHCARMAPAFDEAAAALRLRGMEVGKLDCADRARGGAEFCGRLNVRGFPQVKLFLGTEDAAVDFPMSGGDRSSAALVSFALAGHAARPRQYFREARVRESTAEDAFEATRGPPEAGEEAGGETDDRPDESNRPTFDRRWRSSRKPGSSDGATSRRTPRSTSRRMLFRCLTDHRLGSLTIFATLRFSSRCSGSSSPTWCRNEWASRGGASPGTTCARAPSGRRSARREWRSERRAVRRSEDELCERFFSETRGVQLVYYAIKGTYMQ
jgi:thiol-disulfide isomerase/thioredoxin